MPNYVLTTSYGWIVSDPCDVARDLDRIQEYIDKTITEVEAALAHYHLKRVGIIDTSYQDLDFLSQQMQSLTTSVAPTGTPTDSQSHQTNAACG